MKATICPVKKTLILPVLAAGGLTVLALRCFGVGGIGDIVYDPISHNTQIANFAKELSQWAQNFQNQMSQINQLVTQVRQYAQMIRMIGDPQQLVGALGMTQLGQNLGLYQIAQGYGSLMQAAQGAKALTDNANGLYNDALATPQGFNRNLDNYRVYQFQNNLRDTYQASANNYTPAAQAIKDQIAQTQQQLDQATTTSAIAKLTAKMNALIAQQQSLSGDLERNAFNSMVAANDAQNHRQLVQKANGEAMGATIYQSRSTLQETQFSTLSYGNIDIKP
jgi:hypothetical protein